MSSNKLKEEINKRLKDDLWNIKIAKSVISKQKSIKSRNIKAVSSMLAACFVATVIYVSLFFNLESNQDFVMEYNPYQIIMDDIISFSDEFDIIFSQDIDDIIESAMNARL